jgi:predicted Zn-dependent protease
LKPQRFEWEFRVIESKQVNAFCLPGGKVVVYTGILPVCEDEDGLATVMGHEIGHALAHHGAERVARQRLEQIGQVSVAGSLGNMPPEKRVALMVALGAAVQYGESLPFNRSQESEADHIGLLLMATAGYDPKAAIPFWQRMAKLGGRRPPEFMSTHPGPEHRAQALEGWLPEALVLYRRSDPQNGTRPLPGVSSGYSLFSRDPAGERGLCALLSGPG